jgi:hypothetical protein
MAQQRMAAFEALPALDVAARHRTTEGDRRLAALRAAGPLCQVQPIGALARLRWADCDVRSARWHSTPNGRPMLCVRDRPVGVSLLAVPIAAEGLSFYAAAFQGMGTSAVDGVAQPTQTPHMIRPHVCQFVAFINDERGAGRTIAAPRRRGPRCVSGGARCAVRMGDPGVRYRHVARSAQCREVHVPGHATNNQVRCQASHA